MTNKYPVGGPREPVYQLMRSLGFLQACWTDKQWFRDNDLEVNIFGTGSMARVYRNNEHIWTCQLDDLSEFIADLDAGRFPCDEKYTSLGEDKHE